MTAPKMQVKCGVDNCHYWHNHYCTASALEVNAMGDGHADTSDGTCCTTFVAKGNNNTMR
ncbi:MAG: hypothetical protein HPY66_3032 [Firmicutes bacterium]|nr:hypothetical protein [Bacillota bacterium]MDI6705179.1 DUF1540 domain-containing protein [Bacillota bacterium]